MIEDNIWLNYPAQYVIGADEVGRGSFAGPIVACAVKINSYDKEHLVDVKDSKTYLQFISTLRKFGRLSELRKARETYHVGNEDDHTFHTNFLLTLIYEKDDHQ